MSRTTLSDHDRAALHEAEDLVRTVVRRHPQETNGQILTAVELVVHQIEAVTKYLEAS
jgi:F0F1-type ATP synthase delta subunit